MAVKETASSRSPKRTSNVPRKRWKGKWHTHQWLRAIKKRTAGAARPLNIALVTGTRAEFGIWRSVIRAIQKEPALALQVVATGTHLLPGFGTTVWDIINFMGGPIYDVPMYRGREPAAASLARGTANLAEAFRRLQSDVVLVLGDRLEIIAAAGAALAEQIPIAHVHGGETAPGQWDEQIRHAVTKMAHIHFAATKAAGRRILQLGENPAHVHVVGAPALDNAVAAARVFERTRFKWPAGSPPLPPVLLLHPTSKDDQAEYRRTCLVLRVLLKRFDSVSAFGPNNDPGHRGILRAYREHRRHIKFVPSVQQAAFWEYLAARKLLVGNSSSGIIEAASFGCAVINMGPRQAGRERSGNVIDIDFDERQLESALRRVLSDGAFRRRVAARRNVYGDGHAARRIVAVLKSLARRGLPAVKRFHDA